MLVSVFVVLSMQACGEQRDTLQHTAAGGAKSGLSAGDEHGTESPLEHPPLACLRVAQANFSILHQQDIIV